MAFFKLPFSRRAKDVAAKPARGPAESVETMRRRARHRLIGAAVLVLLGVVGFPLLFDTQPRPVAVDIPIEIPDKAHAKPLVMPTPAATVAQTAPTQPAANGTTANANTPAPSPAPAATPPAAPAVAAAPPAAKPPAPAAAGTVAEAPAAPPVPVPTTAAPAPAPVAKAESKPKPVTPAEAKPAAKPAPATTAVADGARAQALLEGKAPAIAAAARQADAKAADTGRFVVQIGAFADADKAREVRLKVERAGLKTYTNVADTKDGKRTRVRVGPFGTRAEADKAAAKIKGLDLPAAILTL